MKPGDKVFWIMDNGSIGRGILFSRLDPKKDYAFVDVSTDKQYPRIVKVNAKLLVEDIANGIL